MNFQKEDQFQHPVCESSGVLVAWASAGEAAMHAWLPSSARLEAALNDPGIKWSSLCTHSSGVKSQMPVEVRFTFISRIQPHSLHIQYKRFSRPSHYSSPSHSRPHILVLAGHRERHAPSRRDDLRAQTARHPPLKPLEALAPPRVLLIPRFATMLASTKR